LWRVPQRRPQDVQLRGKPLSDESGRLISNGDSRATSNSLQVDPHSR
jgi:hypothetical protein